MRATVNTATLVAVAAIGVVAGVAGFFTDVEWMKANAVPFLVTEVSALLGLTVVEGSRIVAAVQRLSASRESAVVLPSKESVYRSAITVLRESASETSHRSIWMLSGTGGPKDRIIQTQPDPIELDYDRQLNAAISRRGWSTRIIYNVDNIERLDWVGNFLSSLESLDELEARTFVRRAGDMLAPLIVGRFNVLIADGDRRYYRRVRSGVHLVGPDLNEFMRGYFDRLWQSSELHVLRTPVGLVPASFDEIRSMLAGTASLPATP